MMDEIVTVGIARVVDGQPFALAPTGWTSLGPTVDELGRAALVCYVLGEEARADHENFSILGSFRVTPGRAPEML